MKRCVSFTAFILLISFLGCSDEDVCISCTPTPCEDCPFDSTRRNDFTLPGDLSGEWTRLTYKVTCNDPFAELDKEVCVQWSVDEVDSIFLAKTCDLGPDDWTVSNIVSIESNVVTVEVVWEPQSRGIINVHNHDYVHAIEEYTRNGQRCERWSHFYRNR